MADSDLQPDPPPTTLSYQNPRRTPMRTSRAAILSLVLATLGSPLVVHPTADAIIRGSTANPPNNVELNIVLTSWMMLATIAATLISFHTIGRIERSGGNLKGGGLAAAALCLCFLWWPMIAFMVVALIFSGY